MFFILKRLALGVSLIAAAAAVLLITDWHSRKSRSDDVVRIAILQHASQPILDDGVRGMIDGLAETGWVEGRNLSITRFNAENDMPTSSAIAREITNGRYRMVLTASTPSLQAVAHANKEGKALHLFGLVTDPFAAGVGISRENPLQHPAHLAGYGTMQPVEAAFRMARTLFPGLKKVGVAWNPAEANSVANTKKAREVCRQLGIELLEANVDSSSAVMEAVASLVARGAQAIWVGGDVTALVAIDSIVSTARKGGIPVFTNIPPSAKRGALFDLGADYHEVGRLVGVMAGDVLHGTDPRTIAIRNQVPECFTVNRKALAGLQDPWQVPDEVLQKASIVIDDSGVHEKKQSQAATPLHKKWKIRLIEYNNVLDVEETEHGVREGLKQSGLVEGRDYEVRAMNAQGDMATVNGLIDAARSEGTDLFITFSTPVLQSAIKKVRQNPIVFTYVADGVAAGAGKSNEDHLPNVTGVTIISAYDQMVDVIRQCMPSARILGSLFVPSETNMVFHKAQLEKACQRAGLQLVTVAADTSAEMGDAALALCTRKIDAICQMPGNLTAAAFPSIASAAGKSHLPIFAFQTAQAQAGAPVVLARDYLDAGIATGLMAARVMRGESPARIPFQPFDKTLLILNPKAAQAVGLRLPPTLLQQADQILGEPKKPASAAQHP